MNTKNITYIAMFTAIIAVLSILTIPTPWGVPFTLQTFSISLCGFVLGKKYATISTVMYLILGAIGLPVFAGMKGGLSSFVSVTGGFLIGFIFLAYFSGFSNKFFSLIGLFICHLLGVVYFSMLMDTSILNGFITVSMPYIVKDLISIFLAYIVSKKIRNVINIKKV